ncbi:MAG TPA: class I SAM-dependent methyltransferase [Bacteroidia bacterium]|nr:class I SAM-dependent methyltransferase [Bacteroidia bacterium]
MSSDALIQEQNVSDAFSTQSVLFDETDERNLTIKWMREEVREHVMKLWRSGDSILELNAGTGLDAIFFAEKGFNVHATDNAQGMIDVLNEKMPRQTLRGIITTQRCSFNELENINRSEFDHIFSNFGGLNCTNRLDDVINSFDRLLKPGGTATLVIMPKICPWELILALKGNFKIAFRRLKKGGVRSHLEGKYFNTYYYSPAQVRKMFGEKYSVVSIKGLGIFVPPPYLDTFPVKHPRIYKALQGIDKGISTIPPFRSFADHFIISVRKNG